MWGSKPFYFTEVIGIVVANADLAASWYENKLGLRRAHNEAVEADVFLESRKGALEGIALMSQGPDVTLECADKHPILFTTNIDKAFGYFRDKEIRTDPIVSDSGGNRYFNFYDLDNNRIEVCLEH